MMDLARTGSGSGGIGSMVCSTQTTFEGKLCEERANLEKRLANLNSVLEKLRENPGMTELLEALHKLGY